MSMAGTKQSGLPIERPDYSVIGTLEDLAFGGGSDIDDGYGAWNPKGPACSSLCHGTAEPMGTVVVTQDVI